MTAHATPHKTVKVTHAHHRSYRKRHYVALIAFIALGVALINSVWLYYNNSSFMHRLAEDTIAGVFGGQAGDSQSTISSTYGFSVTYSPREYYASAVDGVSGGLYVTSELNTDRAYQTIRFSKSAATSAGTDATASVKLNYYPDVTAGGDLATLEKTYVTSTQTDPTSLNRQDSKTVTVHGVSFLRTSWSHDVTTKSATLTTHLMSYTGIVNGSPLTVIVYQGFAADASAEHFMDGLHFGTRLQAYQPASATVATRTQQAESLLNTLTLTATASAAVPTVTSAERVGATYGPAVVKIYNVFSGDLAIDGKVVEQKYLGGGTGSGFIVSSDGYIATNGHVAVIDPRDTIVEVAIEYLNQGNDKPLQTLVALSGLTSADVAGAKSDAEVEKIIIKKIYQIPASRFSIQNQTANLLVGLGSKQVDLEDLVTQTQNHHQYAERDTIKRATFKSADFEGIILPEVTGEYTKSDVALIKIQGTGYPMVKLGGVSQVAQGADINIMGYPGIGSDNGIVSTTQTSATLTTGKVSSLKKDSDNHNLIETDTTIGHGNSGGPVFDDQGYVVGLATYGAVDGSGVGELNYVRDIQDFKDLADKSSVNYSTVSATQKEWETGIDYFYRAHYKQALASFTKVQKLYPTHPRANEMIASANQHIANGDNVNDFPWVATIIAGVAVLGGLGTTIWFILRHKRGHHAYAAAVTAGTIQPIVPGGQPQFVAPAPMPFQTVSSAGIPATNAPVAPVQQAPVVMPAPPVTPTAAPAPQPQEPQTPPSQQI